jgi:hypothetical protein
MLVEEKKKGQYICGITPSPLTKQVLSLPEKSKNRGCDL